MRVALAVVSAALVGAVVTLNEPMTYRCTATFACEGSGPSAGTDFFRGRLMEFAWAMIPAETDRPAAGRTWFLDEPAAGSLCLQIPSEDRDSGLARVRELASGFLGEVNKHVELRRSAKSEVEIALAEYAAELRDRLENARGDLRVAVDSLSPTDPALQRTALLKRWQTMRADFLEARARFAAASDEVDRLLSQPEPTHGVVDAEERSEVLQADAALQQDLRELGVNLHELKQHLLKVWQKSASDLDRAKTATGEFNAMLSSKFEVLVSTEIVGSDSGLLASAEEYRRVLDSLAEGWEREFAALRGLEVDPLSGDILALYQRLRAIVSDFLFAASKHLMALRASVVLLGTESEDLARLHVVESDLVRAFQRLQTTHRRFEFSASAIDPHENFRLDAALTSARGLSRRSHHRVQSIDEALRRQAAERARKQQEAAKQRAQDELEHWRSIAGDAAESLVIVQEDLNAVFGLSEEYLRAALQAELADWRVHAAQTDIDNTDETLTEYTAKRLSDLASLRIELTGCSVTDLPVNLAERLRAGGVAAALTLLVLGMGLRWIAN